MEMNANEELKNLVEWLSRSSEACSSNDDWRVAARSFLDGGLIFCR